MGTATNHKKRIATTKSGHRAMSGSGGDVNFIDKPKALLFFATNVCPTKHLKTGKTTKTYVDGGRVWTTAGILDGTGFFGSYPSGPEHPGIQKGKFSTTYCMNTKPTGKSPDTWFENGHVIRTGDATLQNGEGNYNCSGMVYEGDEVVKVDNQLADAAARCMIDRIDGLCGHGRPMKAPGGKGDAYFLDIFDMDSVTFTATRLVVDDGTPLCGKHILWTATVSGEMAVANGAKKTKVGSEFDLGMAQTTMKIMPTPASAAAGAATGDLSKTMEGNLSPEKKKQLEELDRWRGVKQDYKDVQKAWDKSDLPNKDQYRPAAPQSPLSKTTVVTDTESKGGKTFTQTTTTKDPKNWNTSFEHKDSKAPGATGGMSDARKDTVKAIAGTVDTLLALIACFGAPPMIVVVAESCAGAKTCTIRLFPAKKYEIDLIKPFMEALQHIKGLKSVVETVCATFKKTVTLMFCEQPYVKLSCEPKELTQDKNGYYSHQVRPAWTLAAGFEPVLGVSIQWDIPILQFATAIGAAAAFVLKKAGITADLTIEVKIYFNFSISGTVDEYNVGEFVGPVAQLLCTFAVGVKLEFSPKGTGIKAEASMQFYITNDITLKEFHKGTVKVVEANLYGQLAVGVKGAASADVWGFVKLEKNFDVNILKYPDPPWSIKDIPLLPFNRK